MSIWAVVENGTVTECYDVMPENWRNISNIRAMETDFEFLASLGWYPVSRGIPPLGPNQTYGPVTHTFDPDLRVVLEEADVFDLAPPNIEDLKKNCMEQIRARRDDLLAQCDWTQCVDVQEIKSVEWKTAWKQYRQQLRDLLAC